MGNEVGLIRLRGEISQRYQRKEFMKKSQYSYPGRRHITRSLRRHIARSLRGPIRGPGTRRASRRHRWWGWVTELDRNVGVSQGVRSGIYAVDLDLKRVSRLAPVIQFRCIPRAHDRLEAAGGVAEAVPANDLVNCHEVAVLDSVGVHAGGMVEADELLCVSV